MILKDLKIRCINLERSPERWAAIQEAFAGYDIDRVEAVDGLDVSDGTFDDMGRPCWNEAELGLLVKHGRISEGFMRYHHHYPTEYAAGVSHLKALDDFLCSDEAWTIVIEDDVEPVGDLKAIEVPDGAGFFSLIGADHQDRVTVFEDGQIAWLRTFGAYAISKSAAFTAFDAMTPSHYPVDMQVAIRCFASMANTYQTRCPKWTALERFIAYAPDKSIVKLSDFSEKSTYTANGKKPWLDNERQKNED